MLIKKGTKLLVTHTRKGKFLAIAKEDFDTEKVEFYPVLLDQNSKEGLTMSWKKGETIACRNTFCTIEKR